MKTIKQQLQDILDNPDNWITNEPPHGLPAVRVMKGDCSFKRRTQIQIENIIKELEQ